MSPPGAETPDPGFFDDRPEIDDRWVPRYDEVDAAWACGRMASAERPTHLGGPQVKTSGAMPARTVALRRDEPAASTAPVADDERARAARRALATTESSNPTLVLGGVLLLAALVSFVVFLFGARLTN